jgi:hypothetical protein
MVLKRDKRFFYGVFFFVKGKKPSSFVFILWRLDKKKRMICGFTPATRSVLSRIIPAFFGT